MNIAPQDRILDLLLQQVGLSDPLKVEPLSEHGITNQMSLVTLKEGTRLVLREYRWPWGDNDHLNRRKKERYLHRLLQQHDIPVARMLADLQVDGHEAALFEFLPGELLGEVVAHEPAADAAHAWRTCGEALRRVHAFTYPAGTYGLLVGDEIRNDVPPFTVTAEKGSPRQESSWGHFHTTIILKHFDTLLQHLPDIPVTRPRLEELLLAAVPILDGTQPSLLHNDPHPWNVLVDWRDWGWGCAGWLDWEWACVGDPTWDLVRMDLFRFHPIGPAPQSFWEGYGQAPPEPQRSVYEMHVYLWLLNEYLNGERQLMPTYEAAISYVKRLDLAVDALAQKLP